MTSRGKSFVTLVLAGFLAAIAAPVSAQGFRWWQDTKFQTGMKLSPEQIGKLDRVFQSAQPALRADERAVDKLEDELSKIFAEGKTEEPDFEQFLDRVESARASWRKNRNLMFYRMRRILTYEQNAKLKELREQREREHRKSNHPAPQPEKKKQQ